MPPLPFARLRQTDITKLIRAALAAGVAVDRIEIGTDGKVTLFLHGHAAREDEPNEWDVALGTSPPGRDVAATAALNQTLVDLRRQAREKRKKPQR